MDRDTSCTSKPALRDWSSFCSMETWLLGDRLGPRPGYVRVAQGATAGLGTTAAPRLRVAAAKVDEKLLFPLAADNADAGWVIPVLSRKIVVVAFATAVAIVG